LIRTYELNIPSASTNILKCIYENNINIIIYIHIITYIMFLLILGLKNNQYTVQLNPTHAPDFGVYFVTNYYNLGSANSSAVPVWYNILTKTRADRIVF